MTYITNEKHGNRIFSFSFSLFYKRNLFLFYFAKLQNSTCLVLKLNTKVYISTGYFARNKNRERNKNRVSEIIMRFVVTASTQISKDTVTT